MDDRALVSALVAGDPQGLAGAYQAYADRLYTYCRGVLHDPDGAADAVHDTFLLASQRAGQLRDPEKLRPWLYAIARNECRRQLRNRSRQGDLDEAGQVSAPETDPSDRLHAGEMQELVRAAAAGLNPGDRELVDLAVRHDLAAAEIGAVLGVSVAHAHARLSRARAQLGKAVGALLVARTGRDNCPQLAALLSGWDGALTALIRKRVARHIDSCDRCAEEERRLVRPAALFPAYAALPLLAVPAELWPRLERTAADPAAGAAIADRASRFDRTTGFPRGYERRRHTVLAGVGTAVVLALLFVVGGPAAPGLPLPGASEATTTSPTPDPAAAPPPAGDPPLAPPAGSPGSSLAGPPTPSPSVPPAPPPTTEPPPPPPNAPPEFIRVARAPAAIAQVHDDGAGCFQDPNTTSTISALVADPDDPPGSLVLQFQYALDTDPEIAGTVRMSHRSDGTFTGVLGPFTYQEVPIDGGRFTVRVSATDPAGNETTSEPVTVVLNDCEPEG